jgi:hypothetical protein
VLGAAAEAHFSAPEVLGVLSELAVDTPRRAATHMITIHEI